VDDAVSKTDGVKQETATGNVCAAAEETNDRLIGTSRFLTPCLRLGLLFSTGIFMTKAIVLFSGGLDSLVTALALRRLGVEVLALNIVTPLHDVSQAAGSRAEEFGLPLCVRRVDESYADLIAHPRWGYGSAVNPCIDCRIAMLKIAKQVMQAEQAEGAASLRPAINGAASLRPAIKGAASLRPATFIATGEVVGQRPNSQKMHQLALIAREAGVTDCLVRPLSARALNPSKVESDGLLDRESLYGFTGRGRTGLMRLAEELGVRKLPQPASGCLLCEKNFVPRVRDVLRHNPAHCDGGTKPVNWHFEVLPFGRIVRIDPKAQCVVARNLNDCRNLVRLFERDDRPRAALFEPESFTGPAALLIGDNYDEHHERIAGGQVLRFSNPNRFEPDKAFVRFRDGVGDAARDERRQIFPDPNAARYKHW